MLIVVYTGVWFCIEKYSCLCWSRYICVL